MLGKRRFLLYNRLAFTGNKMKKRRPYLTIGILLLLAALAAGRAANSPATSTSAVNMLKRKRVVFMILSPFA